MNPSRQYIKFEEIRGFFVAHPSSIEMPEPSREQQIVMVLDHVLLVDSFYQNRDSLPENLAVLAAVVKSTVTEEQLKAAMKHLKDFVHGIYDLIQSDSPMDGYRGMAENKKRFFIKQDGELFLDSKKASIALHGLTEMLVLNRSDIGGKINEGKQKEVLQLAKKYRVALLTTIAWLNGDIIQSVPSDLLGSVLRQPPASSRV